MDFIDMRAGQFQNLVIVVGGVVIGIIVLEEGVHVVVFQRTEEFLYVGVDVAVIIYFYFVIIEDDLVWFDG